MLRRESMSKEFLVNNTFMVKSRDDIVFWTGEGAPEGRDISRSFR
jgi:hypothetical protein